MSGRPNYGGYQPNSGGMGGGMGRPYQPQTSGWNTSTSYGPGTMGGGQGYGGGQSGFGAYNMGGAFQQAPTSYQQGGPVNGSAPPGVGGTMTDLSALYGKLGPGASVTGDPRSMMGAGGFGGGLGSVIGDPRSAMGRPPMPGVTGDPRNMIGRPQTPPVIGDPRSAMGVPPQQRGPGNGIPFMDGQGIVATGPLGSNGQPTITFDDVDRYQRGMLGL